MTVPYEVVVNVPEEPELTLEEQDDLKDSFRASLLETLGGKGVLASELTVQLITGTGSTAEQP